MPTKKRRRIPNHAAALEQASKEVRLLKESGVDAWTESSSVGVVKIHPVGRRYLSPITIYSHDYR